jgi:hypothetical protein
VSGPILLALALIPIGSGVCIVAAGFAWRLLLEMIRQVARAIRDDRS